MNIDRLVKMANEISEFFAADSAREQAAQDVAGHLRRFWDPRMRRQIIDYLRTEGGSGLSELARHGIERLAAVDPPEA